MIHFNSKMKIFFCKKRFLKNFRFGKSLGTGPCIEIAYQAETPFAGLILQSPFLSIFRTVFQWKKTLWFDLFLNLDKIEKIECPIFLIHGKKDEVVPFSHSGKKFKILTFSKEVRRRNLKFSGIIDKM
jgi:fermentation-respiration switch protein FrsA (DUF1100 family)